MNNAVMARKYVVTGAASGIGKAIAQLLTERGNQVIGVDVRDADVVADLSTDAGRRALVSDVTDLSGGTIDAVVANAGLAMPTPTTVAVNYFGAIATLEGLRPLLARSSAPRAVAMVSDAAIHEYPDEVLLDLLRAGDEPSALTRAAELAPLAATAGRGTVLNGQIYRSTKRALAQWVRRTAPTPEWAGAGIALNGIAPGVVHTPMTAEGIASESVRAAFLSRSPMPLGGILDPRDVAYLVAWLTSEENGHIGGEIIFINGGGDAAIRGDATW